MTQASLSQRSPDDQPGPPRSLTLGLIMEQVAGHATHVQTLRSYLERETNVRTVWHEVTYRQPGGWLETIHDRLPWLPSYPFGVARAALSLREGFAKADYDAVLLNSRTAMFVADRVGRVPCLLDTDVTPVQLDRLPGYPGPRDPAPVAALKHRLFQCFLHRLHGVIAWSRWAADSFVHDYAVPRERVHVIPPGIDLEFWTPASRDTTDHDRPVRILFVGGDFQRKGGPMLLRWFREQAPANCELHIVTREPVEGGPGVLVYRDMQPNTPRLRALYHSADIFVLPSEGECFGIATVEAMACGLPVVVTRVGGVADIVDDGANGLLIPAGEVAALRATLESLISDEGRRRRMGRVARSRVEERFDALLTTRHRLALLQQATRIHQATAGPCAQ